MIQEIEVPDGKTLFPYFVDTDLVDLYIQCFASFIPVEYELDDDGMQVLVNDKPVEVCTIDERARQLVTRQLDDILIRWQEKQNRIADRESGKIKSGGIS
jgi:hypothetical protein